MNSFNSVSSNSLSLPSIFPLDISFTPLAINIRTVRFFTTRPDNSDISLVYTLDSGNTYNPIVVNNQAFDISGFDSGLYILKVDSDMYSYQTRFSKK
jgi:hypothetical protein